MQLSLNDFLTPAERLPELLDHRKPKGLKSDRWALAKPLIQSAPVVTENPAEFERVIESVLDTLALNQKQSHERMVGHDVTWITGATLPKPKHHKGKILAVLAPGAKREDWINLLPPEFDEMGKLVKGMEDARQVGKERSKELKALRAEWKRLYKAVKVNSRNGGYLVAEETEEGVVYRCIAPHLVHKQAESQTILLQEGLAETAPASLPEPEQIDSAPAPVCSEQTPFSISEFEAQNPDLHLAFAKRQNDGSVKVEYEGFGYGSGKKAEVIIPATDSTPLSSPSVNSAPEPAAKVILGKPLGRSHPGLGINKPVCFYCKGQEELEYAGLFPNAIKSMNHHIWRCKKQPRHQLVCAEKGDWWYQWCGGVGYGVTYGVPELWMWKDIFQAATGQEPELTPEPEADMQALETEAAELRAKIAEAERLRGLAGKEIELESIIKTASDEMDRICSQGYSERLDAVLAKKQDSIDGLHRELRNIREERSRAIIPATWRWEERLAEIEKELGKWGQS